MNRLVPADCAFSSPLNARPPWPAKSLVRGSAFWVSFHSRLRSMGWGF